MANAFTFPFDGWMGLQVRGVEVSGIGYTREPCHFEEFEPGYFANSATVVWPVCGNDWGYIDTVNLYDAQTGGDLIGTALVNGGWVNAQMYDELRVPAAGYQVTTFRHPMGYGTFTFGTGRWATFGEMMPPGSGVGSPYGPGPYGAGPYEAMEMGALLLKAWATVQLCGGEPGDWAPAGPFDATVTV